MLYQLSNPITHILHILKNMLMVLCRNREREKSGFRKEMGLQPPPEALIAFDFADAIWKIIPEFLGDSIFLAPDRCHCIFFSVQFSSG